VSSPGPAAIDGTRLDFARAAPRAIGPNLRGPGRSRSRRRDPASRAQVQGNPGPKVLIAQTGESQPFTMRVDQALAVQSMRPHEGGEQRQLRSRR
jgi:hypothetical protein